MSDYTIYHNPRCSKSRQTLALLEEHHIQPTVVLYLQETLSASAIQNLVKQLNISVHDLLRNKEEEYRTLGLKDTNLSDDELINAMVNHPKLIERPIVSNGKKAVLGRPPENVLELIQ